MLNKLSVIVHGPYSGNILDEILSSLHTASGEVNDIEIVLSVYVVDAEKTSSLCEKYAKKLRIRTVECKDLINPGYFNINRHLYSVNSAVQTIDADRFVIKLRNDQNVSWKRLFRILKKIRYLEGDRKRLITTNCFTRKDRLYHPSDMFLCAWQPTMQVYFSAPMMMQTHLNCQFGMIQKIKNSYDHFSEYVISPESELFRHYLRRLEWKMAETTEDSYLAIKTYCHVLNTWDINLCWAKKRTPLCPAGSLIYPHYFRVSPFAGAPVENAECYSRADFSGKMTMKDRYYIRASKFLWRCFPDNENRFRHHSILSVPKLIGRVIAKLFPPLYMPLYEIYQKLLRG